MTGLFATLVAAARGEAEAAVPIPGRPAADTFDGAIEWRETGIDALASTGDAAGVRAAGRETTEDEVPRANAGDERRQTGAKAPVQHLPPQDRPLLAPTRPAPMGRSKSVPVSRAGKADEPPTGTVALPSDTGSRAEIPDNKPPLSERTVAPLLPLDGPQLTPTPKSEAEEASLQVPGRRSVSETPPAAGAVHLRIGKIEVRPAAGKPPPAAPRPTTVAVPRATAPARAGVRQSLDDYRSQRRR